MRFARHQQPEKHNQEEGGERREPGTLVGLALIILGVLALAYQGITYTTRETVMDLGPLRASLDAVDAAERHS